MAISQNGVDCRISYRWFYRGLLMAMCVICIAAGVGGCKASNDPNVEIETAYMTVQFPKEAMEYIQHSQVEQGDAVAEVFSMDVGGNLREVFRISFADPESGILLGYLKTKDSNVAVTYTVESYEQDDFPDEDSWKAYYSVMDGFSVVLNSIMDHSDFSKQEPTVQIADKQVSLTYWKLSIPEAMRCEETTEGDSYRVDFYGTVDGQEIKMYSVCLGQPAASTVLGYYTVDGEKKILSVESTDLDDEAEWTEQDSMLMESINDVINVITSDPSFSAE